jgi:hypothetical protein
MSARLWAVIGSLMSLGFSTVRAEPVSSADRTVVVYLKAGTSAKPDGTVSYMQRELATLMQTAGYKVEWKTPGVSSQTESAIAVVELRGACHAPAANASVKPVEKGASLASTAVDGEQILPFSWINCETLTEMLAPSLANVDPGRKDFLYGRAMGRLLAHELYHMLVNKRGHAASGVGKASFSAGDVLSERFSFEHGALAEFREAGAAAAYTDAAGLEEEDAGR